MSEIYKNPVEGPEAETYEKVRLWSRCTFLSLATSYGLTSIPGWFFQAPALLFTLLTVALAITTLVKMVKAGFPAFSMVLMAMLALWSLFLGFSAITQLIFSDAVGNYYTCLRQATTIVRTEQCTTQMSDGLLERILGS